MSEQKRRAGITGLGSAIPEKVLTNKDLEKIVETSDEWIFERTGIRERRIVDEDTHTSDLAYQAAQKALEDAGIGAEELDLIIVATVSPDMAFPATACILQDKLGAKDTGAFDLQAGCSGFVYGITMASQFIAAGTYDHILVVGAETLSRITNWEDRGTCILFGDGAGAAVLSPVEEGGIITTHLGADGSGGKYLDLPAGGAKLPASEETVRERLHYIRMDGNQVYKFAVRVMGKAAKIVAEDAGLTPADIDLFIPHQANQRIITAAARRLGVEMDKVFVNLHKYGNTSGASIPIALDEAYREGLLHKGDNVVMVGFGAGLTWASACLQWVKE
ncbi:MAG: beta-ketoacyl-ACP synthase III [Halanaerobium sp.]|nr:beta-ketoacyl-ACP synthase III [Halanaerobium sp.]